MPCWIFDIGPTVLAEWRFAFSGAGLSFPGLKDYKLIPAQNLRSIQAEEYKSINEMAMMDHYNYVTGRPIELYLAQLNGIDPGFEKSPCNAY